MHCFQDGKVCPALAYVPKAEGLQSLPPAYGSHRAHPHPALPRKLLLIPSTLVSSACTWLEQTLSPPCYGFNVSQTQVLKS